MGTRKEIRDKYGMIEGFVETHSNGDQWVWDRTGGTVLSRYYPGRDVTTDAYGMVTSQGNTAIAALYSKKN